MGYRWVMGFGSVVDGGSVVASFSVVEVGGLMVFLVAVNSESKTKMEREERERVVFYII